MNKNAKKVLAGLGTAALLVMAALPALAQTPTPGATVNATVTPQIISVSVSPTSINYGIVPFSTSSNILSSSASGALTATNTGNVSESFLFNGTNATGGIAAWQLTSSIGSSTNYYVHKVSASPFSAGTAITLDLNTLQSLFTGVLPSTGRAFASQITMPLVGSDTATHTMSIFITATSP